MQISILLISYSCSKAIARTHVGPGEWEGFGPVLHLHRLPLGAQDAEVGLLGGRRDIGGVEGPPGLGAPEGEDVVGDFLR